MNFLERTLSSFLNALEQALEAEDLAKANGLLQRLDPRIKVVGILALIIAVAVSHRLWVIGALFAIALLLAASSRISAALLTKRVWVPVLLFTGIIAFPAPFVIPGHVIWRMPGIGWELTAQGLRSSAYLIARVETAATLSVLLILIHTLDACLEGAARAAGSGGFGGDPGHGLPLHFPSDRERERHAGVAPQPYGGRIDRI